MEVKINKEIRDYNESIFFGLSMRQFIFSILACLVAVGLYFILKPNFGIETLSWVCILGSIPFAALGFIKYNGMTAEKFFITWIRNELLTPKKLTFKANNYYYNLCKDLINRNLKSDFIKVPKKKANRKLNIFAKKNIKLNREGDNNENTQ